MPKELEELEELEEEIEDAEEETEEETTELNEFELCIKDYLDQFSEESMFFKDYYKPEEIKDCCSYIISEVKKTKRTAFTNDEIFKMARDFYTDNKKAPKNSEKASKIIIPKKERKEEGEQLSLFDF